MLENVIRRGLRLLIGDELMRLILREISQISCLTCADRFSCHQTAVGHLIDYIHCEPAKYKKHDESAGNHKNSIIPRKKAARE